MKWYYNKYTIILLVLKIIGIAALFNNFKLFCLLYVSKTSKMRVSLVVRNTKRMRIN